MTTCNRGEDIVSYLYGDDGDADDRRRVEEHLASCEVCAGEAAALGDVRRRLISWVPPEAALGFRIVRDAAAPPARVPPFRRWAAVGALAAAAVLVLAAGAAIANLEVRYGADGLTLRTGWSRGSAPDAAMAAMPAMPTMPAMPVTPAPRAESTDEWRAELTKLQGRLDEALARQQETPPPTGTAGQPALSQVRRLITEAESRQKSELALGLARLAQEFEVQRQADLVRVAQGIGRIETFTGAEVERQRAMLNHLLRVSQQQGQEQEP